MTIPRKVFVLLLLAFVLALASGCTGRNLTAATGWSGATLSGDLLYLGTMEGRVLALEVASLGSERWRFPKGDKDERLEPVYGPPAVTDGRVYVGTYGGKVYALDAASGNKVWEFDTGGQIVGGPAVADGLVAIGYADGLYVIDAQDGGRRCRFPAQGKIGKVWSTPAIAQGVVYFGSLDYNVYAVNLADCQERWRFPTKGAVAATPLVHQGVVYVGSFDRTFYALDDTALAEDRERKVLWTFQGAKNWFWSGVVTDGELVFVPSMDWRLYALRIRDGTLAWGSAFDAGGPILSTPTIAGSRVTVASDAGRVHVLDRRSGAEEWSYKVDAKVRAPLVAAGDRVYLSALDHSVRAVNVERGRQEWQVSTKQ
ncbi:MAG: PQQ-binding-like beta-propeller repeat protein [Chloroflexi bacterium]|nr:PQQ-binding-like beta-propeller repeat protein [Chloroflexota bacterium]